MTVTLLRSALPLAALAASLVAGLSVELPAQQEPLQTKSALPRQEAATQIRLALGELAFTSREDGSLWAASGHYKLGFDTAGGSSFVPFLGSSASRSWPIRQRLAAVRLGEQPMQLGAAAARPHRNADNSVDLVHGDTVLERWHLRRTAAEQTFVITALPCRDALSLELTAETDFEVRPNPAGGFDFVSPDGVAHASAAVAYDAAGRQCTLDSEWRDGSLEHRIPAEFVRAARLPLVIDPVFYQDRLIQALDLRLADVTCYLPEARYVVVAERPYSAADGDIVAWFRNLDGTPASGPFWIDLSGDDWREPAVASSHALQSCLYVAAVRDPVTGWYVRGRLHDMAAPGTVHAEFDLSPASTIDEHHPDVGGDPDPQGTGLFCAVWQRDYAPGDFDVVGQRVGAGGPVGGRMAIATAANQDQRAPRISSTCAHTDQPDPDWLVVWERHIGTADIDVAARRVPQSGTLGTPIFTVAASAALERLPVVAGPTKSNHGHQFHLITYERNTVGNNWDIYAKLIEGGAIVAEIDVSGLMPSTAGRAQFHAAVAAGPARFMVTWHEEFPGVAGDYDVVSAVLHVDDARAPHLTLGATQVREAVADTYDAEINSAVASRWEAGDPRPEYMTVNTWLPAAGGASAIDVTMQLGTTRTDSMRVLPYGCGQPIQVTGDAFLGTRATVTVPGSSGTFGWSGILVGVPFPSPLPLCGNCLLGVDGAAFPSTIHLDFPLDGGMLGAQIVAQGYDLRYGSCFGTIRVSDTIEFTLR